MKFLDFIHLMGLIKLCDINRTMWKATYGSHTVRDSYIIMGVVGRGVHECVAVHQTMIRGSDAI